MTTSTMEKLRVAPVDIRIWLLGATLALTLAFSLWVVPMATAPGGSDTLLGAAQLVWWGLLQLTGLLLALLVLRPPRA